MYPYIAKYKCTQNIVKKCDCTATISHTGVWNSVSESSNIILFNALNRLDSIEQVLGKTKMPPYLTKFGMTLGDPSHPPPVCKQAQLCHPLVSMYNQSTSYKLYPCRRLWSKVVVTCKYIFRSNDYVPDSSYNF